MYYVYVLQSQSTGKIYIGHTKDYKKRLERHNEELPLSKKGYTYKNKGPWKLVYKEVFKTREEAKKREKQLKTYRGREYIKKVVQNLGP